MPLLQVTAPSAPQEIGALEAIHLALLANHQVKSDCGYPVAEPGRWGLHRLVSVNDHYPHMITRIVETNVIYSARSAVMGSA